MLNYLKHLGFILGGIILGTIIITIFQYFGITNSNITGILRIIVTLISIFISSYLLGKKSKSKGYLEGLKLGLIFIFLLLILNLILSSFKVTILLYFAIILFTSILGSMIGINQKKDN